MSSSSIHFASYLEAAKKNINCKKFFRISEQFSTSLKKDKSIFNKKSKVWSTNDAKKWMRQLTKQPVLPDKMVYLKNIFLDTGTIQNVLTKSLPLFLVEENYKTLLPLNKKSEIPSNDQ